MAAVFPVAVVQGSVDVDGRTIYIAMQMFNTHYFFNISEDRKMGTIVRCIALLTFTLS
jgi:hypothetical protein